MKIKENIIMKIKKSFTKCLLVLFLCFGFLIPILKDSKQLVSQNVYSIISYSDIPDISMEP